ncbi:hypothetical protein BpHYR1_032933 [Brachionus plicatilis]|uniref:Uncharacterized protein n=1 Tax=Brachionus plicatilis TaxID=10195 RepID=A0A3M7SWF5_BRAPC|nr:hypothetical protein BpHYR1_032933 [Brachionus plicatilis]
MPVIKKINLNSVNEKLSLELFKQSFISWSQFLNLLNEIGNYGQFINSMCDNVRQYCVNPVKNGISQCIARTVAIGLTFKAF